MYRYPFHKEAEEEYHRILTYWKTFAVDNKYGGFVGRIDNQDNIDEAADKGSVLNARILWSFSAAYKQFKQNEYLQLAKRAFDYFVDHFIDQEFGGVYWTVSHDGRMADCRKQLYASAFALYGISEYHSASNDETAKSVAIDLYHTIVRYGYDERFSGFYEAFTREWQPAGDQRLSAKDANEKKSANTNLHIVEAFASLYAVWPDQRLKFHISSLLKLFNEKIIDHTTGHLNLFFDEEWHVKPDVISYGHDIEAAWLLMDCANIIGDKTLVDKFTMLSLKLADAAMEGLDSDGGLWYEYDQTTQRLVKEKHWWPQAEALVGFYHAWQLTGDENYYNAAINTWHYIKTNIISPTGEWYWGGNAQNDIMDQDKVGPWKCPYHNSRACLELIKRSFL